MKIYVDGKWHEGCDECGEIIEECICDKEKQSN